MLNKKSCFMYFTKTSSNDENDSENDNIPSIMIGPSGADSCSTLGV